MLVHCKYNEAGANMALALCYLTAHRTAQPPKKNHERMLSMPRLLRYSHPRDAQRPLRNKCKTTCIQFLHQRVGQSFLSFENYVTCPPAPPLYYGKTTRRLDLVATFDAVLTSSSK